MTRRGRSTVQLHFFVLAQNDSALFVEPSNTIFASETFILGCPSRYLGYVR